MKFSKLLLGLSLIAGSTTAQAVDIALGARAGSLGLGIEATVGVSPYANVRGGWTNFKFSADFDEDGVDYDADLEPDMVFALADVYPFAAYDSRWRITAGIVRSETELRGSGVVTEPGTQIGRVLVPLGSQVNATAEFRETAPYLAIGWGNAITSHSNWSFNIELGAVLLGSADITQVTESTGQVPQSEIDREARQLQDELDKYDTYWLLNLGVAYRF